MFESNTFGPTLAPYLNFNMIQLQMQRHWIQAWLQSKGGVDKVVVRIAQIAELAWYTCHWGVPMDIKAMTPSMTQYGTYTIGLLPYW